MEELSNSTGGENDISQLLLNKKKKKKLRKEEENYWLIMSGPQGNNYHVNWGRVNSGEIRTRSSGLLAATFHFLGDNSCQFWGHEHCHPCRDGQAWSHPIRAAGKGMESFGGLWFMLGSSLGSCWESWKWQCSGKAGSDNVPGGNISEQGWGGAAWRGWISLRWWMCPWGEELADV